MKRLRVAMMDHQPPPDICTDCINNVGTVRAARWSHNERAYADMDHLLASTAKDGTTSFRPNTLDIRTNLCNLKCRMCCSASSSAIHSESLLAGLPVTPLGPHARNEHLLAFSDEDLKRLKYISWAGGEPFMSRVHWELMDSLDRLGCHDIPIWYNTNLSFPGNTRARAEKLLGRFSRTRLGASIDAVGEDFDYLREGAHYDEVISNLLGLRRVLPKVMISVDCTVTSLGLFSLDALVRFCIEHRVMLSCKSVVVPSWDWLSIGALRRDVLEARLVSAAQASAGTPLQAPMSAFVSHVRKQYRPSVPDLIRCREREQIRGKAGYLESRIGTDLNSHAVDL